MMKRSLLWVWVLGLMFGLVLTGGVAFGVGGNMGGGNGSETTPYLIEDLADFNAFCGDSGYWASGVYTKLMTDLDLSSMGTYPQAPIAGDPDADDEFDGMEFSGNFDGNGHVISNLTLDDEYYCGLFGCIGYGGRITGIGLEDLSVNGGSFTGGLVGINYGYILHSYSSGTVAGIAGSEFVGGLAGYNNGIVLSSYSTGTVSGSADVGGLVGMNNYDHSIWYSYSTSSVSGDWCVGGLVGVNDLFSCISNCYSTGAVTGGATGDRLGGLVGGNSKGSILNSYSTGIVSGNYERGGLVGYNNGPVTDCFWDKDTSGLATSAAGTGKTTAEMKTLSTFTGADWEFVFDGVDGPTDIWRMPIYFGETGYPRIIWESVKTADFVGAFGVGLGDMGLMSSLWLSVEADGLAGFEECDLDDSGVIDTGDLVLFLENWLVK